MKNKEIAKTVENKGENVSQHFVKEKIIISWLHLSNSYQQKV